MKQTSEPAVQPRRNVVTALVIWAAGLWSSTKLWAAEPKCDADYELALLIGRLCIDSDFRNTFFGETDPDIAIQKADVTREKVKDSVRKILKKKQMSMQATATSPNPVQVATENVGKELWAAQALMPCNPWPC